MKFSRVAFTWLSVLVLVMASGAVWAVTSSRLASSQAQQTEGTPKLEWFGWSHYRITSVDGTVILINPFITGNPDASIKLEDITRADITLVANGHGDEQGDAIAIAQKTGGKLLGGGFELGSWFIQQGVPAAQVIRTNPGGLQRFGGITVRIVNSVHGSGLPKPTIENPYGGPAAGFFITLENGYTVYFAGSTAATMDMQLWGSAFKPDLAILPLNNDRDPVDVGQMVKLLSTDNPNLKKVLPHHHRVQPPTGATTIDQMEAAIRAVANSPVSVIRPQRNQVMLLTK
ncbi:MAG: MBL fold metallo-hydrolase [Chloroflexi bacterium]|nr:MBL fold metallo-hydrolase [Chloroflexota bacterium]